MRLVAYSDCANLLSGLRAATEQQVGPYGLLNQAFMQRGGLPMQAEDSGGVAAQAAPGSASRAKEAPDHSGTNVHEAGVDEPDLVKTDGRRIVTVARGRLTVVDAASRKVTGTLALPLGTASWASADLLLSGDRVLLIAPMHRFGPDHPVTDVRPKGPLSVPRLQVRLTLVDLVGKPRVTAALTADGQYVDARQTGSVARIVLRSTPQIDFPVTPDTPAAKATEENRRRVRQAPLEAWLPGYEVTADGATRRLRVPCERVSHPPTYDGTSILSVLTLNLTGSVGDADPVSVVTSGSTVYGTGSSLYVAGAEWDGVVRRGGAAPRTSSRSRTQIHRFDITGSGHPRYAASGAVPGDLLDQYSLSEYEGRLRVATTEGAPGDPSRGRTTSTVYVLAQRGPRLDVVGSVGGLGKGERIYAVRFLGPAGYVVTFRQVDPLYTLDLSDPAKPAVTGELKITGYSSYLHPAGDGRLIGVGQEAGAEGRTLGTQISLFDVSGKPKRLARHHLPDTGTEAQVDPHAFLYWPRTGLTVVPITSNEGAGTALALSVTADGIRQVGTVRHPGPGGAIRRSLVIGDTLWTLSDAGLRANAVTDLREQAWVPFT